MNLIIPMAGMGKRLRPHTLTTPKPLIPIAGKPIVQRLVEDIAKVTPETIQNIGFVVGHFGEEVEKELLAIASRVGAKGHIFYQEQALGTAHAVDCAKPLLQGKVSVAFADTLFRADFTLDVNQDGIIWVKEIEDASAFGVVKTDDSGIITAFIEKPKTPISNKAIIGIYYFKEAEKLAVELTHMIDNKMLVSGEYQLTVALENLLQKGVKFSTGTVDEWLDCGNKNITVQSNARYLTFLPQNGHAGAELVDAKIIEPVFVAPGAKIHNSVIGPGVSIGEGTVVVNSKVANSLIQTNTRIEDAALTNSMIGSYVKVKGYAGELSLGDYSEIG